GNPRSRVGKQGRVPANPLPYFLVNAGTCQGVDPPGGETGEPKGRARKTSTRIPFLPGALSRRGPPGQPLSVPHKPGDCVTRERAGKCPGRLGLGTRFA